MLDFVDLSTNILLTDIPNIYYWNCECAIDLKIANFNTLCYTKSTLILTPSNPQCKKNNILYNNTPYPLNILVFLQS